MSELTQRSTHGIHEVSIILETMRKGGIFNKLYENSRNKNKFDKSMGCPFIDAYKFDYI